jgi:hypothetical protein
VKSGGAEAKDEECHAKKDEDRRMHHTDYGTSPCGEKDSWQGRRWWGRMLVDPPSEAMEHRKQQTHRRSEETEGRPARRDE